MHYVHHTSMFIYAYHDGIRVSMCIEHTKQCVYGCANMCEHVQQIVSCWDAVCVSAVFMYTCVSRQVHGCSMSYEKHV